MICSLTDSLEIKTEDEYRAEDLQMQLNSPSFDKKVPIELKQTFRRNQLFYGS